MIEPNHGFARVGAAANPYGHQQALQSNAVQHTSNSTYVTTEKGSVEWSVWSGYSASMVSCSASMSSGLAPSLPVITVHSLSQQRVWG